VGPLLDKLKSLGDEQDALNAKMVNISLFETHMELVEVLEGNQFFKSLGKILEDSSPTVKTYLKDRYDPTTIAAAKKQETIGAETINKAKFDLEILLIGYEKDVSLAKIAVASAKTDIEMATAKAQLEIAQANVEGTKRRIALR